MTRQDLLDQSALENIAESVNQYVELAVAAHAFLNLKPQPTMEEACMGWLISSAIQSEASTKRDMRGTLANLEELTDTLVSAAFGCILGALETHRSGNIPSLKKLKSDALSQMSTAADERMEEITRVSGVITSTAARVAVENLQLLLRGMDDSSSLRATRIAASLLTTKRLDSNIEELATHWIWEAPWTLEDSDEGTE